MKKAIAIMVCSMGMMIGMTGCGAGETDSSMSTKAEQGESEEDKEEAAEDEEGAKGFTKDEVPETLNYEFTDKDYGFKFWVSTMNGTFGDNGASYRFDKNTEEDMASLFIAKYTEDGSYTDADYNCDLTTIKSSQDIFACMEGKFRAETPWGGAVTVKDVTYKNLETSTINGVEMTKFEGNYTEDWKEDKIYDYAFVGYQILAKNRPILVYIVERESVADNSNVQQYYSLVDDIVSTFVDEETDAKEPGYLE